MLTVVVMVLLLLLQLQLPVILWLLTLRSWNRWW